jgi:hypothetical protein
MSGIKRVVICLLELSHSEILCSSVNIVCDYAGRPEFESKNARSNASISLNFYVAWCLFKQGQNYILTLLLCAQLSAASLHLAIVCNCATSEQVELEVNRRCVANIHYLTVTFTVHTLCYPALYTISRGNFQITHYNIMVLLGTSTTQKYCRRFMCAAMVGECPNYRVKGRLSSMYTNTLTFRSRGISFVLQLSSLSLIDSCRATA